MGNRDEQAGWQQGSEQRSAGQLSKMTKCLICGCFISLLGYLAICRLPQARAISIGQAPKSARATQSLGRTRQAKRQVIKTTAATPDQTIDFARDIQPIFEKSCNQCHGAKQAMGQLRLDDRKLALQGGLSGPAIIPGNSQESRLLKRILGLGGEARMPLVGDPLTPAQIALIRAWIDQGARWPGEGKATEAKIAVHWAYTKPVRPALPAVKNSAWVRTPVDHFILARLESVGLAPSPEAAKETLLRRVHLDLVGLPPSVREVDEFLADRSPNAYEKVVDRLLSSPHYGERWARPWLDLARYADSNGYEKDQPRVMWKYRDWVIQALNRDLPFDQFTIEQMAGDMLPDATLEQKIATGFHRNTMLNQEGGVDDEEARWETLLDRVNTTATVWLGATLACAQCHNHKYDPFAQKDYYRFLAFFDNVEYTILTLGQGEGWVVEPQLDLPTPEQESRRKVIEAEINKLTEVLRTQTPELDAAQMVWEREMLAEQSRWTALDPIEFESTGGASLTKLDDKSLVASGANPENDVYLVTARTDLKNITGVRLEALTDSRLPQGGPGRDPYGNFLLTGFEVDMAPASQPANIKRIAFKDGKVDDAAVRFEAKNLFQSESSMSASDAPKGWAIDATRDAVRVPRQAVFTPDRPFGFEPGTLLTIKLKHQGGALGQGIGRLRLSVATIADPMRLLAIPARQWPILSLPAAQRTERQKNELAALYRSLAPSLKPARDRLTQLRNALKDLGITSALVMRERPGFERPSTYFRERGSFLNKGEKVYAGTPAVLPPMPESQPINRLGLARWLVDENNPLTARVAVNRFWEQFFGRGIVETSEDFGTQGQPPSHPELLDWLATEFVRQKWSMKAIHRLIVTSATYRQSSTVTPAMAERDPYNRLLQRGPRFRMEAEMIRDVTLTASGLLSRRIGGPSVFPLQPEGIWRNPYSSDKWITSEGEDRWRRSLYTFLRRTSPYPSLMTFDGTSREFCTVRRVRTNTPLQALVTLNDEAFFEAARALAERMLNEAAEDAPSRAIYGFRLCVARAPKPAELNRLLALYQDQLRYFNQHEQEAERVIKDETSSAKASPAERAAWAMVANVLLNMDATLVKE
jgi:mono/diheme cytochrome c family protein